MIQSHRYTRNSETRLFKENSEAAETLTLLSKGDWTGILESMDGWFRVLTILGEGWVRAQDVEERSPFALHAQWAPGGILKYVAA